MCMDKTEVPPKVNCELVTPSGSEENHNHPARQRDSVQTLQHKLGRKINKHINM